MLQAINPFSTFASTPNVIQPNVIQLLQAVPQQLQQLQQLEYARHQQLQQIQLLFQQVTYQLQSLAQHQGPQQTIPGVYGQGFAGQGFGAQGFAPSFSTPLHVM
jgi:hypothetical protein